MILLNGASIWPLYSPQARLFSAISMTVAIPAAAALPVLSPATGMPSLFPLASVHLFSFLLRSAKNQVHLKAKNQVHPKLETKFIQSSTKTPSPNFPFMDPSAIPHSAYGVGRRLCLFTVFETCRHWVKPQHPSDSFPLRLFFPTPDAWPSPWVHPASVYPLSSSRRIRILQTSAQMIPPICGSWLSGKQIALLAVFPNLWVYFSCSLIIQLDRWI